MSDAELQERVVAELSRFVDMPGPVAPQLAWSLARAPQRTEQED